MWHQSPYFEENVLVSELLFCMDLFGATGWDRVNLQLYKHLEVKSEGPGND